ncbi:MAG: LLM class flavin-dependent oxidoreductase [Candidatus Rokubacteria bacterium]|nr:LLM class flavin-dependent oxidoreductase [Candidatus Rokubacteria bacterium]
MSSGSPTGSSRASHPRAGEAENPWTTQERVYADTLAGAEYAEAVGFDAVWLAEHHFSEYGICPWMNFGGLGDDAVRG